MNPCRAMATDTSWRVPFIAWSSATRRHRANASMQFASRSTKIEVRRLLKRTIKAVQGERAKTDTGGLRQLDSSAFQVS